MHKVMKVGIEYKERKQDFLILGAIVKINVTHAVSWLLDCSSRLAC